MINNALINGKNQDSVVINGEDLSNQVPVNLKISAEEEQCNVIATVKGCDQESKTVEIGCYGKKSMKISILGE